MIENIKKIKFIDGKGDEITIQIEFFFIYHGMDDLAPDGYPYFLHWGYREPVMSMETFTKSKIIPLLEPVYYAIEYELDELRALSLQKELWTLINKWEAAHANKKHGGRAAGKTTASSPKKYIDKNWDV